MGGRYIGRSEYLVYQPSQEDFSIVTFLKYFLNFTLVFCQIILVSLNETLEQSILIGCCWKADINRLELNSLATLQAPGCSGRNCARLKVLVRRMLKHTLLTTGETLVDENEPGSRGSGVTITFSPQCLRSRPDGLRTVCVCGSLP
ncbi:hypothetical protein J6590_011170 [Homalodisca vitripennis]|nr:hypothetical protein J6590_011170 [Homalodisca vitripennis]